MLKRLSKRRWLTSRKPKDIEALLAVAEKEVIPGTPTDEDPALRSRAQLYDIIEFYRAVHAEMAALVSAASRGVSLQDATMYVTSFPCHECAKHIVGAGIRKLLFVESYPKSRVSELSNDSITIDNEPDAAHVGFSAFLGVAPRRYIDWFSAPKRKEGNDWVEWSDIRLEAVPRSANPVTAYLSRETQVLEKFKKALKGLDKLGST